MQSVAGAAILGLFIMGSFVWSGFHQAVSWSHASRFSDAGGPSRAGTLFGAALALGEFMFFHGARDWGSRDAQTRPGSRTLPP